MSPEQLLDALECQEPDMVLKVIIEHLGNRAERELGICRDLRKQAKTYLDDAEQHERRGQDFYELADAIIRAPVTFPASAIEARQGGDANAAPSRSDESAVAKPDAQKDAPND